jgi:hypothetical protein
MGVRIGIVRGTEPVRTGRLQGPELVVRSVAEDCP